MPSNRGIVILFGILGEKFMGYEAAVGPFSHNVGKGAPSIYPYPPSVHRLFLVRRSRQLFEFW